MQRHKTRRLVFLLGLSLPAATAGAVLVAPQVAWAGSFSMSGVVKDQDGAPMEGATIVLQCDCLDEELVVQSNARGVFTAPGLPYGDYTVEALRGQGGQRKVVTVASGSKLRMNFQFDPKDASVREIVIPPPVYDTQPGSKDDFGADDIQKTPRGDGTDAMSQAAEGTPTGREGAGGVELGGMPSTEQNLTLEGADARSPITGQLGTTVVDAFLESVEVREAGYNAEFGGAAGGQVRARRVSGSNVVRGQAGVRFAPRLASPRFITDTDEALRVQQIPDFSSVAFAVVTGPIVKDTLYFTAGVTPQGARQTLRQSFHARVDKDGSRGYENCPFENGANDCAEGKNYILTEEFGSQSYKTGGINVGYIGGLDWNINPRHTLGVTVNGGPSFGRTTYRLPFSSDPNAFGTNPDTDPLGGASNIATGIVDDHFGWDFSNQFLAGLNYEGRVFDDKMEIDAGVSYFRARNEEAWRLDNPGLKRIPATQEQDAQGRNLYEFLDRENRLGLVPGIDQFCNREDLPGLACPTRVWLSGGIGEFNHDRAQRVEGRFALTNYFTAAGAHALKYGGTVSWLQRNLRSQYSGSNSDDFYDNCAPGEEGGGEYCYNPTEGYVRDDRPRVNNHRFIVVDTDNPEQRFTRGYGRVRYEENDLRAIADPLGRGVRVDAYTSKLSTINYGAFLQDSWSILSNLSVNAGVRWEMQDMRDVLGRRAIFIKDNVAPRVGLVYDWTDEGRSRLYASYGWFFQPLPLQLNSRVFGGLVQVNRQFRLSDCERAATLTADGSKERWKDGQPTEWCTDSNQSTSGLTPGLKVPNLKGQYNRQFQLGYEHEVIEDLILGVRWLHTDLGRAVEDVSTNGGLDFIIANPGEPVAAADIRRQSQACDDLSQRIDALPEDDDRRTQLVRELGRCQFAEAAYERVNSQFPKPQRNYDAVSFQLRKRLAKNWMLIGSYTYSRLFGNYEGFVDPVTGSVNLGSSLQYDTPELVRNARGPLSTDQTHRAKVDGFYTMGLGQGRGGELTFGASLRFSSGFPVNVYGGYARLPGVNAIHMLPRGSGGRLPPNYRVNASVSWAYGLPKDMVLEVGARLFNLTNAKAVLRVDEVYSFAASRPIAGGTLSDLKHAKTQPTSGSNDFFSRTIAAPQGNYGVQTQFQRPMSGQFEVKLRF